MNKEEYIEIQTVFGADAYISPQPAEDEDVAYIGIKTAKFTAETLLNSLHEAGFMQKEDSKVRSIGVQLNYMNHVEEKGVTRMLLRDLGVRSPNSQ